MATEVSERSLEALHADAAAEHGLPRRRHGGIWGRSKIHEEG